MTSVFKLIHRLNQIVFLAKLHYWHQVLRSSLAWSGPSVFLLPPLVLCFLTSSCVLTSWSLRWIYLLTFSHHGTSPEILPSDLTLRLLPFHLQLLRNAHHQLCSFIFPFNGFFSTCAQHHRSFYKTILDHATKNANRTLCLASFPPITFHSVQPSAQSRRAFFPLKKKNLSSFSPCVCIPTHSQISFSLKTRLSAGL